MDERYCGVEGALVMKKDKQETRGIQKENTSPKPLAGIVRGADFMNFTTSRAQRLEF